MSSPPLTRTKLKSPILEAPGTIPPLANLDLLITLSNIPIIVPIAAAANTGPTTGIHDTALPAAVAVSAIFAPAFVIVAPAPSVSAAI